MSHILLVEDNDDHAILARAALLKCEQKYAVDRLSSAEECLDMLRKKQYDAIVLDYSLPKKNGLEVLKNITEMFYDAPVVMITSHGDEQVAVEVMKCGAYDYVSKSDDYLNKLPRVLQKAIESHELIREKASLQARIEQTVNQLRNIFENVEVGLIEIKDDCSISYANPKAKNYLNMEDDFQTPKICEIFSGNNDNTAKCYHCIIRRCLSSGGSINCDIDYNGRQFSSTITATQISQPDAKQLVAVLIDVTEQIKLQRQLIQSERIGALGRMASGVAHDFNNMLTSILGRAELMLMKPSGNAEIDHGLRIMRQAALDGANTVRRIQEFTGVAIQREAQPIKVNSIIEDVIKMTEPRWKDQLQKDGVKVDVSVDLKSHLSVLGNDSDLREVLANMVFNALDAMPKGGLLTFKTYDEKDNVYITISDTGVGIPPEIMDSIFEPFFTSKGTGHSGLGLSAAYGIISRYGGKIYATSKIGEGATFIIQLPGKTENVEKSAVTITPKPDYPSVNANILVIDDEEAIREILSNLLTRFNNKVTVASDGFSGLKAFRTGKYDIVFTDLGMPGMSGWEVAQQIKTIDPNVNVVLVTGWGVELADEQLAEKDIDLVIAKPFQINQIMTALSELVPAR